MAYRSHIANDLLNNATKEEFKQNECTNDDAGHKDWMAENDSMQKEKFTGAPGWNGKLENEVNVMQWQYKNKFYRMRCIERMFSPLESNRHEWNEIRNIE